MFSEIINRMFFPFTMKKMSLKKYVSFEYIVKSYW